MTNKQYQIWQKSMRFGQACGCHQRSDRSFHFKGVQFPFCARCTGLIIGEFIFAPVLYFLGYDWLWMAIAFIGIMAIDGSLQYFNILESTNIRRLFTGILAGIGYMLITIKVIVYVISMII